MPLTTNPQLQRDLAFINGQWISTPNRFAVHNPATGEVLAQVANCQESETKTAIAAASAAFPHWSRLTAKQRATLLRRWFELILQNQEDLARLVTLECGKPLTEAKGEVVYGASFIEWFAEEAKRANGEVLPTFDASKRLFTLRQPVGVCAAITPWNFPLAMVTRKVAPAIAVGCTVIIKPAEQTPLSALALAALAVEAGLPPGVVNVITADSDNSIAVGKVLCDAPEVRHLSFTGSTSVGRILAAQSAPTLKRLALELGGNAPFIVFDDADLDAAVEGAMQSKFRNAGQTCVCANRFYVQKGIYPAFVEKLGERIANLKVGNGLETGVQQGPLIDNNAVAKVAELLANACDKGAQVKVGGAVLKGFLSGQFFQPTLVVDASAQMRLAREEIFGPVAALFPFATEAEAIALANNSDYGLSGYFYSRDVERVWRVAEALQCGMVGVNTGLISTEIAPFGGVKQSGYGREGSQHGIQEYLDIKYLCIGGNY